MIDAIFRGAGAAYYTFGGLAVFGFIVVGALLLSLVILAVVLLKTRRKK